MGDRIGSALLCCLLNGTRMTRMRGMYEGFYEDKNLYGLWVDKIRLRNTDNTD